MKNTIILLSILFSYTASWAGVNEPCKGVIVPANISSSSVIFEIQTYNEYVHGVALEAIIQNEVLDDKDVLNEVTFKKIRKAKIKSIKENYSGDYKIMSKNEVKAKQFSSGFVFQEKFLSSLISESSNKFEGYTSFSVKDFSTSIVYTLVDPSQEESSNCIVKKGEYRYSDLLVIIQK